MKKIVCLFLMIFCMLIVKAQSAFELQSKAGILIIKPSIDNLIKVIDCDFETFESFLNKNGYMSTGSESDMVGFRIGFFTSFGTFDISKSQYRSMISITWLPKDLTTRIFEELRKELTPYFKSIDDGAMIFNVNTIEDRSYTFVYNRKDVGEILIAFRTK